MKKLYLLLFSLLFAAGAFALDKKVMVVSERLPADDMIVQTIMTKIDSLTGVSVTHVSMADAATMTADDIKAYDACVITENGGSTNMAFFGNVGWPIPCVHMKAYAFHKSTPPLYTSQTTDVNWRISEKSPDLLPGVTEMVVKDNSDILKCWAVDQVVAWTTGYNINEALGIGASEAHIQAFDLKEATMTDANVLAAASVLANSKHAVDNAAFPANLKTFMWKVEENATTKRLVAWGVHHTFMEFATADFYNMLKNSVLWVLKMDCECPGQVALKDVETRPYQLYPNPVEDQLNFSGAGLISNIDIVDVTGKVLISARNDNHSLLQINTASLVKGMYFVRVNTLEGKTYTDKLVK